MPERDAGVRMSRLAEARERPTEVTIGIHTAKHHDPAGINNRRRTDAARVPRTSERRRNTLVLGLAKNSHPSYHYEWAH